VIAAKQRNADSRPAHQIIVRETDPPTVTQHVFDDGRLPSSDDPPHKPLRENSGNDGLSLFRRHTRAGQDLVNHIALFIKDASIAGPDTLNGKFKHIGENTIDVQV